MPWEVFQTTHPRFIRVQGFRMQAQITRARIPGPLQATYDLAVTNVVNRMTAEALGSTGMVFHASQAEVMSYLAQGIERMKASMAFAVLPTAAALALNPAAVASAQHALVQIAFMAPDGTFNIIRKRPHNAEARPHGKIMSEADSSRTVVGVITWSSIP